MVRAEDAQGQTVANYLGGVHFSSSDARATLPADYIFTAADHGVHTFSGVALGSAGGQTLTATNGVNGAVTEIGPIPNSGPQGITAGPDGNLWFTEFSGNKVGKITPDGSVTEYGPLPTANSSPRGITAGPDGNLWITEQLGNKVGKLTPAGALNEYALPTSNSSPRGITAGPDGNLWFTEAGASKVGRITPTGVLVEVTLPPNSQPDAITAGPDGNLWFVDFYYNLVGKLTPAGAVTAYVIPTSNSQPDAITAGPDGNLWFTESNGNKVGKITPAGNITEYAILTSNGQPEGIAAGPDGNLWFTESNGNKVGKITVAGALTEYPFLPSFNPHPLGMTAGLDDNLWFTESFGNKVGKIATGLPRGSTTIYVVAAAADHFALTTTAANPDVAGTPFSVTVTAQDPYGNTATGFRGTAHFRSSDPTATLPADYTFTAADQGAHTFSGVVLRRAGGQTLTLAGSDVIGFVTESALPTAFSSPAGITAGPDGNLWFNEFDANQVGEVTPARAVTAYAIPTFNSQPEGITAGPDGNL
jgi:streptogramin lyase